MGGIDSGARALAKIRAGASLIALYAAFIFHGLRLLAAIKSDLSAELRRREQGGIDALVGADAAALTAEPWPRSPHERSDMRAQSGPDIASLIPATVRPRPLAIRARRMISQTGRTMLAPRRR